MTDAQETTADIIAEMRGIRVREFQDYADRLETAWKRERAKIEADALAVGGVVEAAHKRERESDDAKIADLQSRVKLWTDRSAELVKKCDELYADARKSKCGEAAHRRELSKNVSKNGADFGQLGDAAKLREALKLCLRGMCGYCRMDAEARGMTTECVNGCEVMLDAKSALSAPPRNCDKYSHDEALRLWATEPENGRNGCFDEWLYEITEEGGAK